MTTPTILHWKSEWGPLSEQAMSRRLREEGYGVAKYEYSPGTLFPMHLHSEDKIDTVLSGRFKVSWEGGSAILEAGDMIRISAGTRHSAEVVGAETVVSLDAVKFR